MADTPLSSSPSSHGKGDDGQESGRRHLRAHGLLRAQSGPASCAQPVDARAESSSAASSPTASSIQRVCADSLARVCQPSVRRKDAGVGRCPRPRTLSPARRLAIAERLVSDGACPALDRPVSGRLESASGRACCTSAASTCLASPRRHQLLSACRRAAITPGRWRRPAPVLRCHRRCAAESTRL